MRFEIGKKEYTPVEEPVRLWLEKDNITNDVHLKGSNSLVGEYYLLTILRSGKVAFFQCISRDLGFPLNSEGRLIIK